ncbi:hypothetical protein FB567DRAFT_226616 [Paraphoma chrysanthemicola]|uniref:Uncharacterized protein n=1 Tax=Paraphoma chrysanthemicola TaxID=798071 RepID=A0A8K0W1K3_9PLEO|nr:hypothetical protein FB567DRAFT_226616 [Paraphoma chrysanthemicola]
MSTSHPSEGERFLRRSDEQHMVTINVTENQTHTDSRSSSTPEQNDALVKPPTTGLQDLFRPERGTYPRAIFLTSVYSTAMSGLFFVVATIRPRYGFTISSEGQFTPSSAALLTAFLAKTIEISFVMVFLIFLGQTISRRALRQEGISLSLLGMRSWILQPGTLLTQWRGVRVVGLNPLAILSVTATFLTLLYTTAAGTLVQPQLRLAPAENRVFEDWAVTDFHNITTARVSCPGEESVAGGATTPDEPACAQRKWATSCGSNFHQYLSSWEYSDIYKEYPSEERRVITAALNNDNTGVTTAWIEPRDMRTDSQKFGRPVNNVTVAIPHRWVPRVAMASSNRVLRPRFLFNAGSFSLDAFVAHPALNALCITANRSELAPIVYETWPGAILPNTTANPREFWPDMAYSGSNGNMQANNDTALDTLFGWRNVENDEDQISARPVFYKYPLPGNTIANHTTSIADRTEIYILSSRPSDRRTKFDNQTESYVLCSLRMGMMNTCITRYSESVSGKQLDAVCNSTEKTRFSEPPAFLPKPAWRGIATDVINALDLNSGVVDGNSSYSRVLTQFPLREIGFLGGMPSPAEALLSLSTCTVLELTDSFSYNLRWDGIPRGETRVRQAFEGTLRITQYMSGGETNAQRAFLGVLGFVFVINLFILVYLGLFLRVRLITDLCEPLALFIVGHNSPPGNLFRSSYREGVRNDDLAVPWVAKCVDDELIVVGMDKADEVELNKDMSSKMRLRSWKTFGRSSKK